MMTQVKMSWFLGKTYNRMRKLYDDLVLATQRKDVDSVIAQLYEIVESCHVTLLQWSADDETYSKAIQSALSHLASTDWSSIFIEIIDLLFQDLSLEKPNDKMRLLMDLLNKCLVCAEEIFSDERYKALIAHTPLLIKKVLDVMDKVDAKEAKFLAIRVIGALSQNDRNKVEIGKMDGIRKILSFLVERDQELTSEITKTIKKLSQHSSPIIPEDSSAYSFWSERISKLAKNAKILLSYDILSVIGGQNSDHHSSSLEDQNHQYIPTRSEIQEILDLYASKNYSEFPIDPPETEDLLKDYMRMQGAISSLTEVLRDMAISLDEQFNVFETLCKLLFRNQMNHEEFMKMNGYDIFFKFLSNNNLPSDISESSFILKDFSDIMFTFTVNGSPKKIVRNLESFKFLIRIACSNVKVSIRLSALKCVQDLISVNPLNVAAIIETGSIGALLDAIAPLLQMTNSEIPSIFDVNDESVSKSQYLSFVDNLFLVLNYVAVLSLEYDNVVLEKYVEALCSVDRKNINFVTETLASSIYSIIQDFQLRKGSMDPLFMSKILNWFRHLLYFDQEDFSIPMNKIDVDTDAVYFKFARSNESVASGHSMAANDFEAGLIETLINIFAFQVSSTSMNFGDFQRFDGLQIIAGCLLKFSLHEPILTCALYILRLVCTKVTDDNVPEMSNWIVSLMNENISLGHTVLNENLFSLISFLCKSNDSRIKLGLVESGILSVVEDVIQVSPLFSTKKASLQMASMIILNCDDVKECISKSDSHHELFLKAIASHHNGCGKFLWALLFEISVLGSLLPLVISSEELQSENSFEKYSIPEPKLLFNSTLEFTQPRKSSFRRELDSNCFDFSSQLSRSSDKLASKPTVESARKGHFREKSYDPKCFARDHELTLSESEISLLQRRRGSLSGFFVDEKSDSRSFTNGMMDEEDFQISRLKSKRSNVIFNPRDENFVLLEGKKHVRSRSFSNPFKFRSVVFRDLGSCLNILKLLKIAKGSNLRDCLHVLCCLAVSNPKNSCLLVKAGFLESLIDCLPIAYEEEIYGAISRLIETLMTQNMYEKGLKKLIELVEHSKSLISFGKFSNSLEFRKNILDLTCRISDPLSRNPRHYFHFNGVDGYLKSPVFDKLSGKQGYTLSLWFYANELLGNEVGLLYAINNKESVLLELKLRCVASNSAFMHARTNVSDCPPEDFLFENFSFSQNVWYQVIFTQSMNEICLFVNGCLVQKFGTLTYPFLKERNLHFELGKLSRRVTVSLDGKSSYLGAFYGGIGQFSIFEGCWSSATVLAAYKSGFNLNSNLIALEHKEVILVNPIAFSTQANLITCSSYDSAANCDSSEVFFLRRASMSFKDYSLGSDSKNIGHLMGDCFPCHNVTLTDCNNLDALVMHVLDLMRIEKSVAFRKLCLSLVGNFINQSNSTKSAFISSRGYSLLQNVLLNDKSRITKDYFEILLSSCCRGSFDNSSAVVYQEVDPMIFTLDLMLQDIPETVKFTILRAIVQKFMENPAENLRFWKDLIGFEYLFDLMHSLSWNFAKIFLPILESLIQSINSPGEMQRIFRLVSFVRKSKDKLKYELIDILGRVFESGDFHIAKGSIVGAGGLNICLYLMDSADECFRFKVLRLLDKMLRWTTPKVHRASFSKVNGFEIIGLFAVSFSDYDGFVATLLEFAFGGASVRTGKNLLHPEIFKILFDWAASVASLTAAVKALKEISNLLEDDELSEIFWDQHWIEWISVFFRETPSSIEILHRMEPLKSQFLTSLKPIIFRLMSFDMNRSAALSHIQKNRGFIVDDDRLQVLVVRSVVEVLLENPILNDTTAVNFLNSFFLLYRYMEDNIFPLASLNLSICRCINLLAYRNSPTIRKALKTCGFFDLRDEILIDLLELEVSEEELRDLLQLIQYQSAICEKARFRERIGVARLLWIFSAFIVSNLSKQLNSSANASANANASTNASTKVTATATTTKIEDSQDIRLLVLEIISKNVLCFEENRKLLGRLLIDNLSLEVYDRLVGLGVQDSDEFKLQAFSHWYHCTTSPEAVLRRNVLEQRLQVILMNVKSSVQKSLDRLTQKQAKRAKTRKDRILKQSNSLNKSLLDVSARGRAYLDKMASQHQSSLDSVRKERFDRSRLPQ